MIAAQHDRDAPCADDLADSLGDRPVCSDNVGGQHGRVAEVDDPQIRERVDLRLEVRPGRATRSPNRARAKARPGAVGHAVVGRSPDDGHVGSLQLTRILGHPDSAEAERTREIRLLSAHAPALHRVDHGTTSVFEQSAASWLLDRAHPWDFRRRNVRVMRASPYS